MKAALSLIELIVTIFISSIIFLATSLLYKSIYTSSHYEYKTTILQMDLHATQLLINRLLYNSYIVQLTPHAIHFHPKHMQGFLQNHYSGIADISKSSKEKLYTSLSQTHHITSRYILFNHQFLYPTRQSFEENYIYFNYPNEPKTVYEHYIMLEEIASITWQNHQLFFNNALLLDDVDTFKIEYNNSFLEFNLCVQTLCTQWSLKQ